ncbi:hypothetical protein VTH06DRAFT_529 [Thermothelomyces fergusii]
MPRRIEACNPRCVLLDRLVLTDNSHPRYSRQGPKIKLLTPLASARDGDRKYLPSTYTFPNPAAGLAAADNPPPLKSRTRAPKVQSVQFPLGQVQLWQQSQDQLA